MSRTWLGGRESVIAYLLPGDRKPLRITDMAGRAEVRYSKRAALPNITIGCYHRPTCRSMLSCTEQSEIASCRCKTRHYHPTMATPSCCQVDNDGPRMRPSYTRALTMCSRTMTSQASQCTLRAISYTERRHPVSEHEENCPYIKSRSSASAGPHQPSNHLSKQSPQQATTSASDY